jgi:hypothetical protein
MNKREWICCWWISTKVLVLVTLRNGGEKWIKFNYKQLGYYRVIYSDNLWEKFLTNIQVNIYFSSFRC